MMHDLLDFKANWREFCDHSYFIDLTSNQTRLQKWINLDFWFWMKKTDAAILDSWAYDMMTLSDQFLRIFMFSD